MTTLRRLFVLWTAFCVSFGFTAQARAQAAGTLATVPSISYSTNGGRLLSTVLQNTASGAGALNAAIANTQISTMGGGRAAVAQAYGAKIGLADAGMTLTRSIGWPGVAAVAIRALPYAAAGAAAYDLYNKYRVQCEADGDCFWDPGVPRVTEQQPCWNYSGSNYICGSSVGAVAQAGASWAQQNNGCSVAPGCSIDAVDIVVNPNGASGTFKLRQRGVNANGTPWAYVGGPNNVNPRTNTFCKARTVSNNGQTVEYTTTHGPDNLCGLTQPMASLPTELQTSFQPISKEDAAKRPVQFPVAADQAKAGPIVKDAWDKGVDLTPEAENPIASGPASVNQPNVTVPGPNGQPTTMTPQSTITYEGDSYRYETTNITVQTTTTTTNNNGGTTTIITNSGPPTEVCGLPGKPPCKIDESGTPTESLPSPDQAVTAAKAPILACITAPTSCFPTFPTLNWSFALPAGCGVIPVPAFSPWLSQIDVCQFQPMFHEIMGVVWQLGGLFGAISIFWRKVFSA